MKLILKNSSNRSPLTPRLTAIACTALILGQGFLTSMAYVRVQQRTDQQVAIDFEKITADHVNELLHQLESNGSLLYATRGLFAAAKVDATAWSRFAQAQIEPGKNSGTSTIGYAEIKGDQVILTYAEGSGLAAKLAKKALGSDLMASPERKAALEKARTTGALTATGRLSMLMSGQTDFLLILPLSEKFGNRSAKPPIFGYAVAAFNMEQLIRATIGPRLDHYPASLNIKDITGHRPATLFERQVTAPGPMVSRTTTIQVADRSWQLTFEMPRDALLIDAQRLAPYAVLAIGIGFTSALCILTYAVRLRGKLSSSG